MSSIAFLWSQLYSQWHSLWNVEQRVISYGVHGPIQTISCSYKQVSLRAGEIIWQSDYHGTMRTWVQFPKTLVREQTWWHLLIILALERWKWIPEAFWPDRLAWPPVSKLMKEKGLKKINYSWGMTSKVYLWPTHTHNPIHMFRFSYIYS